jgi:hypothetical protein
MRTKGSNQTSVEGASSAIVPVVGVSAPVADPARPTEDSPKRAMFIDLTLQGAPRGAHVLLDGKVIGEAPGPVPLPAGDAPIQVTVTASGYESGRITVVPNQAASATVTMRRRGPGPASSREGIPRDLENPF